METKSAVTQNPFVKYTISMLPNRMKRLTFLASMAAIAKDTKVPDLELISKLNRLFELSATGDEALKLPIHVSRMIWSNRQVFQHELDILINSFDTTDAVQQSAQMIVESTPKWFWYADKQTIIKEVLELFTSKNSIFPTHAMS